MKMDHAFGRAEEWRAARADEAEFIDIARALRDLASELGHEPREIVSHMAARGLQSALGVLSERAGSGVEHRYWQYRAKQAEAGAN